MRSAFCTSVFLVVLCRLTTYGQPLQEWHTTVSPLPDEEILRPCEYRMVIPDAKSDVKAAWIVFDRGQDYLNWYEATQTPGATGQFEKYLRTVEAFAAKRQPLPPPDSRISNYLDSLEQDFAPLLPNMIPGPAPSAGANR